MKSSVSQASFVDSPAGGGRLGFGVRRSKFNVHKRSDFQRFSVNLYRFFFLNIWKKNTKPPLLSSKQLQLRLCMSCDIFDYFFLIQNDTCYSTYLFCQINIYNYLYLSFKYIKSIHEIELASLNLEKKEGYKWWKRSLNKYSVMKILVYLGKTTSSPFTWICLLHINELWFIDWLNEWCLTSPLAVF